MLTELLWLAAAKQQHDIQKAAGVSGIVGFISVILIAIKWEDWFYPLFQKLGLVDLVNRLGFIHDIPVVSAMNIVVAICVFILFIGVTSILLLLSGVLLLSFGNTQVGSVVMGMMVLLLFFPILVPVMIHFNRKKKKEIAQEESEGIYRPKTLLEAARKDSDMRESLKKYEKDFEHVRLFKLYQDQVKRKNEQFELIESYKDFNTRGKAKSYLNRAVASIENDREWLIGVQKGDRPDNNKFYVLFPNPLPTFASQYFLDDCYKEDWIVRSSEYMNAPKGISLYDFSGSEYRRKFGNDNAINNRNYFYVPAIEIEFNWDGFSVVPSLVKGAKLESARTNFMDIYKAQTLEFDSLFEELNKKEEVLQGIKEAHIATYLIPIAYPILDDSDWGCSRFFQEEMAKIPNVSSLAPLYAADVQERIVSYAKLNKEWAIQYLSLDV